jgi:hypothetical protein
MHINLATGNRLSAITNDEVSDDQFLWRRAFNEFDNWLSHD